PSRCLCSETKIDVRAAGRNRRSATGDFSFVEAAVSAAIVPVRLGLSPLWGEGEDEGFLDVEAANRHSGSESAARLHLNGSIRNASGRCVSSFIGVPTRSLPSNALKRASVSYSCRGLRKAVSNNP